MPKNNADETHITDKVKRSLKKALRSYRHLPDKKQYVEFFTALLSVPVLLTVILINLNNLNPKKSVVPTPTPTQQEKTIIVSLPPGNQSGNTQITPQPNVTSEPCNKQLAPVTITSPDEGDTVTDNPVFVTITYDQQNYCSVAWSYRINGGAWSDYGNNSLSLYNLPQGPIKLDLRVQSIVTGQQSMQTRNFTYKGTAVSVTPVLSPTPNTSSSSAH